MPNLSDVYDVRYKARNFPSDGVKDGNRISMLKSHTKIPNLMIGSKVTEYTTMWDFLSLNYVKDTTFTKVGINHVNHGWDIDGYDNYGAGAPETWNCWKSYGDSIRNYNHRIEDNNGIIINELFDIDKVIEISSFMGQSLESGNTITVRFTTIGDVNYSYRLTIEYDNYPTETIDSSGGQTLGSKTVTDAFTFPTVSDNENTTLKLDVFWDDGRVSTDSIEFQVAPPGP